MPFRSQSQWRWAFANKKPWADKWAKHTAGKLTDLPEKVTKAATTGNFSARAGEKIGGQQCRDANGHFVNCDEVTSGYQPMTAQQAGSSMAAYEQAAEEAKIIESARKKKLKRELTAKINGEPIAGSGSSGGGGAVSPAERKRRAREEQKKNETMTHSKVGPGGALGAALSNFADPDNPGMLPNLTAMRLVELGLVEMSPRTGKPYITGEGRAYISAARSGDEFAAREAMQRAQDHAIANREAEQQRLEAALAQAEEQAFQQQLDMIQGDPRQRQLQRAYEAQQRQQQQAAGRPSRQPKAEPSRTYGSGKVITGSPKSTVKETHKMHYEIPIDIQAEMTKGMTVAQAHGFSHPSMRYHEKAVKNEPLTYKEVKDIRAWHDSLKEIDGSEDQPTAEWIVYQLLGGQNGFYWVDSVMSSYEMAMSAYKSDDDKFRIPSQSASTNAIRGLDIQHQFKRGGSDGMLSLGRKIANREKLTDEDIRAMHAYLHRHTGDRKDGWADLSDPSVSYINWMIHGGDEGLDWASEKVDMLKLKREKLTAQYKARRDQMMGKRPAQSAGDYALPAEKRFPITDYGSVTAAINEWPQYHGLSKYEDFKKGLTAVAIRKGLTSALPKAWRKDVEAAQTQKAYTSEYKHRQGFHDQRDHTRHDYLAAGLIGAGGGGGGGGGGGAAMPQLTPNQMKKIPGILQKKVDKGELSQEGYDATMKYILESQGIDQDATRRESTIQALSRGRRQQSDQAWNRRGMTSSDTAKPYLDGFTPNEFDALTGQERDRIMRGQSARRRQTDKPWPAAPDSTSESRRPDTTGSVRLENLPGYNPELIKRAAEQLRDIQNPKVSGDEQFRGGPIQQTSNRNDVPQDMTGPRGPQTDEERNLQKNHQYLTNRERMRAEAGMLPDKRDTEAIARIEQRLGGRRDAVLGISSADDIARQAAENDARTAEIQSGAARMAAELRQRNAQIGPEEAARRDAYAAESLTDKSVRDNIRHALQQRELFTQANGFNAQHIMDEPGHRRLLNLAQKMGVTIDEIPDMLHRGDVISRINEDSLAAVRADEDRQKRQADETAERDRLASEAARNAQIREMQRQEDEKRSAAEPARRDAVVRDNPLSFEQKDQLARLLEGRANLNTTPGNDAHQALRPREHEQLKRMADSMGVGIDDLPDMLNRYQSVSDNENRMVAEYQLQQAQQRAAAEPARRAEYVKNNPLNDRERKMLRDRIEARKRFDSGGGNIQEVMDENGYKILKNTADRMGVSIDQLSDMADLYDAVGNLDGAGADRALQSASEAHAQRDKRLADQRMERQASVSDSQRQEVLSKAKRQAEIVMNRGRDGAPAAAAALEQYAKQLGVTFEELNAMIFGGMNKSTVKAHQGGKDSFSPPAGVRSAAKRGLELRSKFGRGGTSVGIARARDLSNGSGISASTIRRMNSFFARHAVDKRPDWSNPSNPSNGYIAHLLWGGDAGRAWASKVSKHLDAKTKEYPPYVFNSHIDIYRHRNDEALKKEQQRHKIEYSIKARRQRAEKTFDSRQKSAVNGKSKPNDPALWKRAIAEAKKKYDVYPSAYANGFASSWYKKHGGTWRSETKSTTKPSNVDYQNALQVRKRPQGQQTPSKGAGVLSTIVNM